MLTHAAYAILTAKDGDVSIELRQVPVDMMALEASVAQSGMPQTDCWLELCRGPDRRIGSSQGSSRR